MESNYLAHYGVLGMKWGRRRGSNDSSNSSSKSMSDDELQAKVKRLNLEKQYKDLSKHPSKLESTKRTVDAVSGLVGQAKNLNQQSKKATAPKMDLSKMSDQQLRDRINRQNLEQQYSTMFGSEKQTVSKGQQYADRVLSTAGTALAVGSSALSIALAIKELRK